MNLLNAALYDPGTAVTNKATSALLAMTAFDTTNLRLTVTAPPSGRLWIVIICTIHGATTCPQIILGCLEGSTVRGRVTPEITVSNLAATSLYRARAEYCLTGLTPGQSYTLDAAYGVETVVASTNIKYGGPNNTTGNDNFGAFQFEIWDPSPAYTPSAGVGPTTTLHQKIDTLDDFVDTEVGAIKTKTDFLPSATAGAAGGLFIAGTNAATSITTALTANITGNLSGSVGSVTGAVGSVTGAVGSVTGAVGSVTAAVSVTGDFSATMKTSIGTAVAASAVASVTGNVGGNVNGSVGSVVGLTASNLDATISSRMATYAQPTGFLAATFPSDPADQSLVIAATDAIITAIGGLDAPDNASIATILGKTNQLTFTETGLVDANVQAVNDVALQGAGTTEDKWRPA